MNNSKTKNLFLCPILLWIGACAAPKSGILVMAHGGDAAWNRDVQAAVAPLRKKHPIEIAFGMARSSTLKAAAERLERRGVRKIAVVRMFISGDSFLEGTEIILGLRPPPPAAPGPGPAHAATDGHSGMEPPQPIRSSATFCLSHKGVGDSPLVDDILLDRVAALSTNPAEESVLILAHGPGDEAENQRWLANMRLRVQRIHGIGAFRHIECETLREDWPTRRAEATRRIRRYVEEGSKAGGRVIVVPFRVAGFGPYRKVLDGLTYVADGRGFCPHPNMTRWIESTAEKCLSRGPAGQSQPGAEFPMTVHIDRLLETCCKRRAGEIRIRPGEPPQFYIRNTFVRAALRPLTKEDIEGLIRSVTPDDRQRELADTGRTSFTFQFGDVARFYVRILVRDFSYDMVIRPV